MRVGSPSVPPRRRRSLPSVHALPAESSHAFPRALTDLKAASGWGWRDFADQVSAQADPGRTYSHGFLQQVADAVKPLAPGEAMWSLCRAAARATGIEPTYFREYREHLAAERAAELATRIGLDKVLKVLDALERRDRR